MKATLLHGEKRTGEILKRILKGKTQQSFRFAVAYARKSGVALLERPVRQFIKKGGIVQGIVGINQGNTSHQGLSLLLDIVGDDLYLRCGRRSGKIFHPKLYFLNKQVENFDLESAVIGSSNLTRGGLKDNEECDVLLENFSPNDVLPSQIEEFWRMLFVQDQQFATVRATESMLKDLLDCGALVDETRSRVKSTPALEVIETQLSNILDSAAKPSYCFFAMTLSSFDISDKSQDPVILIPIGARNENPKFWFWPEFFVNKRKHSDLYLNSSVSIDGEKESEQIRFYMYLNKWEFRLRSEIVKRRGEAGDILVVQRENADMNLFVIRQNDPAYEKYRSHLTTKVRSKKSDKHYGYFNKL